MVLFFCANYFFQHFLKYFSRIFLIYLIYLILFYAACDKNGRCSKVPLLLAGFVLMFFDKKILIW